MFVFFNHWAVFLKNSPIPSFHVPNLRGGGGTPLLPLKASNSLLEYLRLLFFPSSTSTVSIKPFSPFLTLQHHKIDYGINPLATHALCLTAFYQILLQWKILGASVYFYASARKVSGILIMLYKYVPTILKRNYLNSGLALGSIAPWVKNAFDTPLWASFPILCVLCKIVKT